MITNKIKNILSRAYDQKSLNPIFNAVNSVLYNLFKLKSLKSAVQEQDLKHLIPKLKEISSSKRARCFNKKGYDIITITRPRESFKILVMPELRLAKVSIKVYVCLLVK